MCRGRKIDETLPKYILRGKTFILRVSLFLLACFFFPPLSPNFSWSFFNPINYTVFLSFHFFPHSHFLFSWSCAGEQNFLQLGDILVMLIDIRATSEAGKSDSLSGGQRDLCQCFLPWGKTPHPETGPLPHLMGQHWATLLMGIVPKVEILWLLIWDLAFNPEFVLRFFFFSNRVYFRNNTYWKLGLTWIA